MTLTPTGRRVQNHKAMARCRSTEFEAGGWARLRSNEVMGYTFFFFVDWGSCALVYRCHYSSQIAIQRHAEYVFIACQELSAHAGWLVACSCCY